MPNIVKITTKFNFFDLLVPHSCRGCGHIGSVICNCCKKNILIARRNFCPICKSPNSNGLCKKHPSFPPTFAIDYRHGLLDQLIHEYKYDSVHALAMPLAEMLNDILPKFKKPITIVPLPTITKHIRERGLDHTLLIAKQLAKVHKSWQVKQILIRNHNTVQVGANRETRLTQADLAYAINPKIKIDPEKTYLIIDDVWTTGASISSAVKKLRQSGVKNIVIALLAVSEI